MLVVLIVSGCLAGLLRAAGDRNGAAAVLGVVYVSAAGVLIDGIALLVAGVRATLCLLQLHSTDDCGSSQGATDGNEAAKD